MNQVVVTIAMIFGFMLAEQRLSRANERRLRAAGAIEPPGDPYLALSILYPAAFLVMGLEGAWRAAHPAAAVLPGTSNLWLQASDFEGASWGAAGVVLFAASKLLKYWAIGSLAERWSFRVLIQPERPLVASGPYRYIAHPNYLAVVGELVSTAMMVTAIVTGPLMTVAFGIALWARLRFEERVLKRQRDPRR
jgi:isoprenylcysteine carboxyl methyltransferase (ICMT) family protein YpbQ